MKQPTTIALCNQKGGVGKSTLAVCLATYLRHAKGKNLLVVDCDTHQHSLVNMRQRDVAAVEKSDEYKQLLAAQFERTQLKAYPIVESTVEGAPEKIAEMLAASPDYFDLVIVDLPGSITSKGVLRAIINMDYVVTPIVADRMVMQSTLAFATAVQEYCKAHTDLPLREFLFVWNKVDRRASTEVYDIYNTILQRLELHVLQTVIHESRRFDKELSMVGKPYFRSTLLLPPTKLLKGSDIDTLAEELCALLKI